MPTMTVRPITEADFARWKVLWEGYLVFYEAAIDDANTTALFRRLLTPDTDPRGLVACDADGHIVGITHFMYHPTCWSVHDKCYLQDLFVDPTVRGGGAGRALIKAVHAEASKAGASEVYWMTQEFNSVARVLYDKVGEKTPFIKYKMGI